MPWLNIRDGAHCSPIPYGSVTNEIKGRGRRARPGIVRLKVGTRDGHRAPLSISAAVHDSRPCSDVCADLTRGLEYET